MDHMSMGVEYFLDPINTSGARYHSVTTWPYYFGATVQAHNIDSVHNLPELYLMRIRSNRNAKRTSKSKIGEL